MIQEIHDIFPKLSERNIYKLLLAIKCRYIKFGKIWLSRLEASRFWISERQLQSFIDYLREVGAINKIWMVKWWNNCFKCNVYKLWKWFIEWLQEVKDFIKKTFEYINPTAYIQARFNYKIKYWKIKFKVNWNRYIIATRWRFKDVIYDVWNNYIINPLDICTW